jgi:hypothetical protein
MDAGQRPGRRLQVEIGALALDERSERLMQIEHVVFIGTGSAGMSVLR